MPLSLAYFFALLTMGSLIYLLRESILGTGPLDPDKKHKKGRKLSPIEVAFLSKDGDDFFALIVLIFDVVHREVKDKVTGGEIAQYDSKQRSYELAIKQAAGGSIKDWAMRKVESVTKVAGADLNTFKDPKKIVTKLPGLYKFMRSGMEGSVRQVFRDPRNIKKFISVPGLLRLAADIGTTTFRDTLDEELRDQLTTEGFLASDETRQKTAKLLLNVFCISQFALLTMILLTLPSHLQAFLIYFCGLFSALVVQACTGAREFIPIYSDLARALAQVKSDNARIAVVRMCLKVVTVTLNVLSIVAFVVIFGTGSAILYGFHAVSAATYWMLIGQMLVQLIAFGYLFEAYKLKVGQMPTKMARANLAALRRKYQQEATLPALKAMLSENEYTPELSYLIALYGLETLLLI